MPNPQKFFLYSAGLFLFVLTVIISACGGVITVNVNLNLTTLPPSLVGDSVSQKPSYYYSFPPPVEDYPRMPEPPDDEFLYPPDSERYNEFDWSPMVPGNPKSKGEGKGFLKPKPRGSDSAVNPPLDVETVPSGPDRFRFF